MVVSWKLVSWKKNRKIHPVTLNFFDRAYPVGMFSLGTLCETFFISCEGNNQVKIARKLYIPTVFKDLKMRIGWKWFQKNADDITMYLDVRAQCSANMGV